MNKKPKAVFCWSGGKDSALALFRTLKEDKFQVVALLTTLNENHRRISIHGIREELLDVQAESIGIKLEKVWVKEGNNEEYERVMKEKLLLLKDQRVTHILFGDIFLEDLRAYRENSLKQINLVAEFPLWKEDTTLLIREFVNVGFETITCCVSTKFLNKDYVGKKVDLNFINHLPSDVDACGENGEFHTFCHKGPLFSKAINFTLGEKVFKPINELGMEGNDGFWFIDLLPAK